MSGWREQPWPARVDPCPRDGIDRFVLLRLGGLELIQQPGGRQERRPDRGERRHAAGHREHREDEPEPRQRNLDAPDDLGRHDEDGVRLGVVVSVKVQLPDGLRQVRQYSLSADVDSTDRRVFTTKLDDGGEVSPVLHRNVQVGDVLELSDPYGDVTLDEGDTPVVFATAGIGCTPSASALRSLARQGSSREVIVLHAEKNLEAWALRDQMVNDIEKLDGANLKLWLEEPAEGANTGFMSLQDVELPADASVYVCGPLPFMKSIRSQAIDAGIPATKIHYEVFGPDLWLASAN